VDEDDVEEEGRPRKDDANQCSHCHEKQINLNKTKTITTGKEKLERQPLQCMQ
jgi:hypothetical protein